MKRKLLRTALLTLALFAPKGCRQKIVAQDGPNGGTYAQLETTQGVHLG